MYFIESANTVIQTIPFCLQHKFTCKWTKVFGVWVKCATADQWKGNSVQSVKVQYLRQTVRALQQFAQDSYIMALANEINYDIHLMGKPIEITCTTTAT